MIQGTKKEFEIGKLGIALCLFSLLGFVFAGYFSVVENVYKYTVNPLPSYDIHKHAEQKNPSKDHVIGPIIIDEPYTTFEISTYAEIPANHWTFIEVEVENKFGDYLYAFGQELWHETGRDSDGAWREKRYKFESNLTFPEAGEFYLNFMVSSKRNKHPSRLKIKLIERKGSAMLHFWAGVLLFLGGLACIEIQYGIFQKAIEASMNNDD